MIQYTVTARGLHLRSRPELGDNILGTLPRGMNVEMVSQTGHWMEVRTRLRRGWVASKYLALAAGAPLLPTIEEFGWMPVALAELGQKEVAGAAVNPRVLEYLASVQLQKALAESDETAWCSAFVNWCVERSGHAGTNSALARSWLYWGHALERPRRGAIGVFSREAAGHPNGGHVGFYIEARGERFSLYGGNQGNSVCYADYPQERLLGWRVP